MDTQPVDSYPFTISIPGPSTLGASPAAGPGVPMNHERERNPATLSPSAPPVPFVAHRDGRFFIIQQLPASLPGSPHRYRCILATGAKGYVSHRDFGPHDSDYVLALRFGQAFEENGE